MTATQNHRCWRVCPCGKPNIGQRFGFPVLLALDRPGRLSPIVMRHPAMPAGSPQGRRLARFGDILVETKHGPNSNRAGAPCSAQSDHICEFAEYSPPGIPEGTPEQPQRANRGGFRQSLRPLRSLLPIGRILVPARETW